MQRPRGRPPRAVKMIPIKISLAPRVIDLLQAQADAEQIERTVLAVRLIEEGLRALEATSGGG
jgi:hypothetical protein